MDNKIEHPIILDDKEYEKWLKEQEKEWREAKLVTDKNLVKKRKEIIKELQKLDELSLKTDEIKLINDYEKICFKYLKTNYLKDKKDDSILQLKRILKLLKKMDPDNRNDFIWYGKHLAEKMYVFKEMDPRYLLSLKKKIRNRWPNRNDTVLWSFIFPGQPYNGIEEPISKDLHQALKKKWWDLQEEKWKIVEDFHKEAIKKESNNSTNILSGAALTSQIESEEKFDSHIEEIAKAVNNVIKSVPMMDHISKKGNFESRTLHNIHNSLKSKSEMPKLTLRNWFEHEEKRERIEQKRKNLTDDDNK